MDPYFIRTAAHNVILKRIVWLRNATHQLVALTRSDANIADKDIATVREAFDKYTIVRDRKEKLLKTNYEFYQDAALNEFLLAAKRFLDTHAINSPLHPPPPRYEDIASLNDKIWTDYWFRYDEADDASCLNRLYEQACFLHSYVVVDPFANEGGQPQSRFNPYGCKRCILDSAYTAIGRFENLCNSSVTEYPETFTKCLNLNPDTGLCSHICAEETSCGQRYELAILNALRTRDK